jgi:hypothetical protein
MMAENRSIIPPERIESAIIMMRRQRVLLSPFLAGMYGVQPRTLIQAVKRNIERFPPDFMFQLSEDEFGILKSQIVISSWGGARRARPYAFTEQGVAMLSSVLNSPRAVQANIGIMRAFVKLRQMLASNDDLRRKLLALESKYDSQFRIVFDAIREMMEPSVSDPPRRRIGFDTEWEKGSARKAIEGKA